MHGDFEIRLGEALADFEVALIEELVTRNRLPVDVPKPAAHAHAGTVLGVVQLGGCRTAPPQLRKRRLLVLTGAFDVHDRVARDPAFTLQFGTELARSHAGI